MLKRAERSNDYDWTVAAKNLDHDQNVIDAVLNTVEDQTFERSVKPILIFEMDQALEGKLK